MGAERDVAGGACREEASSSCLPLPTSHGKRRVTRICFMRTCFVLSLLTAAAICGVVAFSVIRGLEVSAGEQTYDSIAVMALERAQEITYRKIQGAAVLSNLYSYSFPDEEQWPFVSIPGYIPTVTGLGKKVSRMEVEGPLSPFPTYAFNPLVRPHQVEDFEAYAQRVFREQGYPLSTGEHPELGFGINGRLENGTHYRYGPDAFYNLSAPIFQFNNPSSPVIMFDIYGDGNVRPYIDSAINCSDSNDAGTAAEQDKDLDAFETSTSCMYMTDFHEMMLRPGPAAMLGVSIYPANSPNKMTGIITSTLHWEETLTRIVPTYVHGLECVISTYSGGAYTFVIEHGDPRLVGIGDLHNPSFDQFAHSRVLNDYHTGAAASVQYTLTVYPTDDMFHQFSTPMALGICFSFVAVIVFCTVVFFIYDYFVKHQARQQAVVLDLKRRFVRFISHEIRSPLNTVCMGLQLISDEIQNVVDKEEVNSERIEGDNQQILESDTLNHNSDNKHETSYMSHWLELLTDITQNAHDAVVILNDLLSYDKIETGSFQLVEIGLVNIWKLVRTTVNNFQIQAKNRKIQLSLAEQPDNTTESDDGGDVENCCREKYSELRVIGDGMRLKEVLYNIVSNSLKFSPENGTVHVLLSYIPDGLPEANALTIDDDLSSENSGFRHPRSGSIRICVQDNGVGISKEQLPLLFNEGFQIEKNKLQAGGGSGLGLFISLNIVQKHGGTIEAHSEGPDHGTTFIVELPLCKCPVDCSRRESSGGKDLEGIADPVLLSPQSDSLGCNENHHRILVVDDVILNTKMLVRLLERAGHHCSTANDGAQAIDAFIANRTAAGSGDDSLYDTILMDYEMPVLNGPKATKKLRDMGCKASIVGVTGNVLPQDVAYFKSQGADAVLPKPIKLDCLTKFWDGT